jgi:hypothetical protein
MSRRFHLGDILSVTTGRLLSPDGISGVYRIENYMTGESLFTHQLGRAMQVCAPALLQQYPQLVSVDASSVTKDTWRTWLNEQIAQFGERLPVVPLPIGTYHAMDPLEELRTMVPDEKIIVVTP